MTNVQIKRKKLVQREWRPEAKKLRRVITKLRVAQLARALGLQS